MLLLAVLISVPSILKLTFEAAVGMFTVTTYCISRTFQVFANLFSFCVGMNANHQFDLWLLWLLLYNWSLHSLFFYVYVTASQCLDFGLPGVLGIAFGGFLIGVLLIGALWFIKIKTGKCTTNNMVLNIDLNWSLSGFEMFTFCLIQGTQLDWTLAQLQQIFLVRIFSFRFVSFLFVFSSSFSYWLLSHLSSGCPCSGAKRQPVSTNPSPSENSSANASIGSTQSTPTSSMAWDYGNLHH